MHQSKFKLWKQYNKEEEEERVHLLEDSNISFYNNNRQEINKAKPFSSFFHFFNILTYADKLSIAQTEGQL